jgi:hypothetical protein
VLAAAKQSAGLDDFSTDWARESLDNLVRFLNSDSTLDPRRRTAAYTQIVEVLAGRLRLVEDRKRYPDIDREKVVAPIIVMGFGRSGTTFLHSLIAEDPANRTPTYWEVARPSPPPSLSATDDPRIEAGNRDIEEWLNGLPGFLWRAR